MKRIPNVMKGKFFWLTAAFVMLMLAITLYYLHAAKSKTPYVENKEFVKGQGTAIEGSRNAVDMYFFYTSWCPHCKTAFPVWNSLKTEKPIVKGITINYIEVDCEKEADTAEKFAVDGYPTIKLVHGKQIIEYDAKPDLETLKHFIETSV